MTSTIHLNALQVRKLARKEFKKRKDKYLAGREKEIIKRTPRSFFGIKLKDRTREEVNLWLKEGLVWYFEDRPWSLNYGRIEEILTAAENSAPETLMVLCISDYKLIIGND